MYWIEALVFVFFGGSSVGKRQKPNTFTCKQKTGTRYILDVSDKHSIISDEMT